MVIFCIRPKLIPNPIFIFWYLISCEYIIIVQKFWIVSSLTEYLGTGREMLESELPTLRAALREAVLIREQRSIQTGKDIRSISMTEVMDTVGTSVQRLWLKSNSQFMPPLTVEDKSVKKKLMDA